MSLLERMPDDLIRRERGGQLYRDVRRSADMTAWIEANVPGRVTLWQLHEERVLRGHERPFDPVVSLEEYRRARGRRRGVAA